MKPQRHQQYLDQVEHSELRDSRSYTSHQGISLVSSSSQDILSAASYFDHEDDHRQIQITSPDMSLGYVLDEDAPSDFEPSSQRKKARVVFSGSKSPDKQKENIPKKQRGRPKLEPQDETTVDRRRTQLRLAQRAYRQRKESTISSLKGKVSELQQIVDRMDKSFVKFHDSLIDSGLLGSSSGNELMRELSMTRKQYEELSKLATTDWEQEDDDSVSHGREDKLTTPTNRALGDNEMVEQENLQVASSDYEFNYDIDEFQSSFDRPPVHVMPSQIAQLESALINAAEYGRQKDAEELSNSGIEIGVPQGIGMPSSEYTYSFQETTFARRLHRQCLELGFRYLSNPATTREHLRTVFRFSFSYTSKDRVFARFQDIIRRKAGENLENWNVPFFPIGGAGTHFPRRDEVGNAIYPPNMLDPVRMFGARDPHIEPETPISANSIHEILKFIGFDGTWYDSRDVEEYLKTKGIFLTAQTSYVPVDPKMLNSNSLAHSANDSTNQGERASLLNPMMNRRYVGSVGGLAQTFGQSDLVGSNEARHQQPTSQQMKNNPVWMWSQPATESQASAYLAQVPDASTTRQVVMFDVQRFLDRLVDKARCLGRAPGFRKVDVDEAIQFALQDIF